MITLLVTIVVQGFFKGFLSLIPVLVGIIVGYVVAVLGIVKFDAIMSAKWIDFLIFICNLKIMYLHFT